MELSLFYFSVFQLSLKQALKTATVEYGEKKKKELREMQDWWQSYCNDYNTAACNYFNFLQMNQIYSTIYPPPYFYPYYYPWEHECCYKLKSQWINKDVLSFELMAPNLVTFYHQIPWKKHQQISHIRAAVLPFSGSPPVHASDKDKSKGKTRVLEEEARLAKYPSLFSHTQAKRERRRERVARLMRCSVEPVPDKNVQKWLYRVDWCDQSYWEKLWPLRTLWITNSDKHYEKTRSLTRFDSLVTLKKQCILNRHTHTPLTHTHTNNGLFLSLVGRIAFPRTCKWERRRTLLVGGGVKERARERFQGEIPVRKGASLSLLLGFLSSGGGVRGS